MPLAKRRLPSEAEWEAAAIGLPTPDGTRLADHRRCWPWDVRPGYRNFFSPDRSDVFAGLLDLCHHDSACGGHLYPHRRSALARFCIARGTRYSFFCRPHASPS